MMDSAYFATMASITAITGIYRSLKLFKLVEWIRSKSWLLRLISSSKDSIRSPPPGRPLQKDSKFIGAWKNRVGIALIGFFITFGLFKLAQKLAEILLDASNIVFSNSCSEAPPSDTQTMIPLPNPIFAKVIFDFTSSDPQDLTLLQGDLLAILKVPGAYFLPRGNTGNTLDSLDLEALQQRPIWIYARSKEGQLGLFPSNYLQILPLPPLSKSNA